MTGEHIFVSYSRSDTVFVDRLEQDLVAHPIFRAFQLKCWVDRNKIELTQDWAQRITHAIQSTPYLCSFCPLAQRCPRMSNER
jgi:TIR domain